MLQMSTAITSITSYLYSIRFRSVQYSYFGVSVVSMLNFLGNGIYSPPASYLLYYTISGTAVKQQCKSHSVEDQDIHIYNYYM